VVDRLHGLTAEECHATFRNLSRPPTCSYYSADVTVSQCTLFDRKRVGLYQVRCVWSDYTGICMNDAA